MKSINNFSNKFFEKSKHSEIAGAYLESLFQTEGRFSLESVSDQNDKISYEQVHHFISDSESWNEERLNNERLQFLNKHKFTQTQANGILVIDDTQTIKNGQATEGVYYQHCGSTGRQENCLSFVTSHYTDEHKNFPYKASTYYPHEETKIDLACHLIDDFFANDLQAMFVAFDCWYFTKQIVRKVESQDKLFVSKPKLNRIIFHQGKRLDARSLVTASSTSDVYFDEKVVFKGLGQYRLIIFKGEAFVTNDFDSSQEKIISVYRQRWSIDESYRAMKDKLNLDSFQVRKPVSILRHIYLVFLAYTFYLWAKTTHIFYRIYQGTILKLSDLCKVIRNLNIYRKTKMKINDLLASLKLKPNLQV
ncbi:MAG: hypothetical protein EPN22_17640 [Nitrospirae bacterium]|nr:MAG: hypothetical protein EPN22_17640 [Nitrospirota bacterium]